MLGAGCWRRGVQGNERWAILGSMRIDVAVLPAEAAVFQADCYVVVDVLRATTTMATLFGRGLKRLLVVDDIEVARREAKTRGVLLFGEVMGERPEGFDYGNSPTEALALDLMGREAMHFTTNGTKALCDLAGTGKTVFAGAIANCGAIAAAVRGFESVAVVCAAQLAGTHFGIDDFFAAGVIAARIRDAMDGVVAGDAAILAMELAEAPGRLERGFLESEHAKLIIPKGFEDDVRYATRPDTSAVAPRVVESGAGWAWLEG